MARKRIVYPRSIVSNTNLFYLNALRKLDIELIDIPFDPRKHDPGMAIPDGDLLILVDCGLPVEFKNLERYGCPKHFVSIDSCHKLDLHKAYCEKYKFDLVWVAQKPMVAQFAPDAKWLPLAADEDTHVYSPALEKRAQKNLLTRIFRAGRYDIGMCGSSYKHRKRFERLFKKAGLSTNFHYGTKLREDATIETARSTIGFNAAAGFTGEKGKDINMRVFETMANGRAMLRTNTYDGLGYEELFEEARHYVGFRTEGEA
ncbi:MAG: glycosyltransferase family 1 protein, partial [Deltaproteobacteria bacterium]|nr:glycosyltransferase family 1 protein [Deltaproteobacteria bacterium]